MLAAALDLAARGLPVFPLWAVRNDGNGLVCVCPAQGHCRHPGKHPMTKRGLLDASIDGARITHWWRNRPDANIALATGAVVVIDTDPRHGGDRTIAEIQIKHEPLPPTWRVATGGGGEHIYFRAPHGHEIRNSAGKLGSGVDVRGAGGYVVAPPSTHVSGCCYRWRGDPSTAPLATLPSWLTQLLDEPRSAKPPTEWRSLVTAGAAQGQRNDALARLAGHLLRKYVDPLVALELLLAWNSTRCVPPLEPDEVECIVESILTKEIKRRST